MIGGADGARERNLLFLLAGLYPAAFFASNNWYIFTAQQLAFLVAVSCLASLVLLSLADLAFRRTVARRLSSGGASERAARITRGFRAASALALCGSLLRRTFLALQFPAALGTLIALILLGAVSWLAYARGLRVVNGLLLGLTLMTALQWGHSVWAVHSQLRADNWYNGARELSQEVTLEKTPNVYFVIAESYPNRLALQKIYSFANHGFYADLETRGFTLFHRGFSNYHATVNSLASAFAMSHHYGEIEIGSLDSFSARDVISARIFNAVIDTFERHDYFVQYVHETNYQLLEGASLDYYWPPTSRASAIESFLGTEETPDAQAPQGRWEAFQSEVEQAISRVQESARPHFTYLYYTFPGHSPFRWVVTPRALASGARFRRGYPEQVHIANQRLLEVVDRILAVDEEALIAIAGDHGSWGYRLRVLDDGTSAPDPLVALDRLGTLVAIRFPRPYEGITPSDPVTLVNLFRYVFAYLADSDEILATRAPDDGYTKLDRHGPFFRAIEGGRPLDSFRELDD